MISLVLDINEVNMILQMARKHPFEEVAALILKITEQATPQVAALNSTTAESPPV